MTEQSRGIGGNRGEESIEMSINGPALKMTQPGDQIRISSGEIGCPGDRDPSGGLDLPVAVTTRNLTGEGTEITKKN